jgi:hypothetical protein
LPSVFDAVYAGVRSRDAIAWVGSKFVCTVFAPELSAEILGFDSQLVLTMGAGEFDGVLDHGRFREVSG